jgi:hypothetical protein
VTAMDSQITKSQENHDNGLPCLALPNARETIGSHENVAHKTTCAEKTHKFFSYHFLNWTMDHMRKENARVCLLSAF